MYADGPLAAYFTGSIHIGGDPGIQGPIVTAIDPDHGELELFIEGAEVTGENFQDGAIIQLINAEDDQIELSVGNIEFVSSTMLTCDIDLDSRTGAVEGFSES